MSAHRQHFDRLWFWLIWLFVACFVVIPAGFALVVYARWLLTMMPLCPLGPAALPMTLL